MKKTNSKFCVVKNYEICILIFFINCLFRFINELLYQWQGLINKTDFIKVEPKLTKMFDTYQ